MPGTVELFVKTENMRREMRGLKPFNVNKKAPQPLSVRDIEREYTRDTLHNISHAKQLIDTLLVPEIPRLHAIAVPRVDGQREMRFDVQPWAKFIKDAVDIARRRYETIVGDSITEDASKAFRETSTKNRQTLNRQMRSLLGIDVFVAEPDLVNTAEAFVEENVQRITSIPREYFKEIESLVLSGFRGGQRAETLAKVIEQRFSVAESKARLIARDQISKLNGSLTRNRQVTLGIKGYIWRTAQDEVVRKLHQEREGRKFSWDNPPSDGHPGQPINCRCFAEPDISNLS